MVIKTNADLNNVRFVFSTGLEALASQDERFGNYKNDLFTHKSRELDRELMGIEENKNMNASITSYLRLLSGYFQLPSALRTVEYLIRRYKYALVFIFRFFAFFHFFYGFLYAVAFVSC